MATDYSPRITNHEGGVVTAVFDHEETQTGVEVPGWRQYYYKFNVSPQQGKRLKKIKWQMKTYLASDGSLAYEYDEALLSRGENKESFDKLLNGEPMYCGGWAKITVLPDGQIGENNTFVYVECFFEDDTGKPIHDSAGSLIYDTKSGKIIADFYST